MSVHIAFETPQDVQEQVYEMVKSLGKDGKGRLKKGANEVTKAAERGTAQMIVMAENVNPGELLAHIPMICKEKSIPFIYVNDQAYLAEAESFDTKGVKAAAARARKALGEMGKLAKARRAEIQDKKNNM